MGGYLIGSGRKRAAIVVIGALTALAAGCSSGGGANSASPPAKPGQTSPAQEVQLAASTAGTVNSFTATLGADITAKTAGQGAQSVTVTGTMSELVHPSQRAETTLSTVKAGGVSLPGGMSEIITPTEIYVKMAALSPLLHTDKQWVGMSVSSLSNSSGLNLSSLFSQSDTSNPLTMAQLLAGAKDVKTVGTGTVDGVPVTEYSGSYSLATALNRLPASERNAVNSAFKRVGLNSGTARFTVWIDAQHIVRKDVTVVASSTFSETVTLTVTSVNQPVTITPPPASDVYTLSAADLDSPV